MFCDEAHIHLDTDLGYGWEPVGKRLFVNSCSRSLGAKVTCFGFYALGHSEPVQIWPTTWANGQTTCDIVRRLRQTYPDRPLVLFRITSALIAVYAYDSWPRSVLGVDRV